MSLKTRRCNFWSSHLHGRALSIAVLLSGLLWWLPGPATVAHADENFRQRLHAIELKEQSEADIETETIFGRNVAGRVLSRFKLDRDRDLNRYINLLGVGLASHTARPELSFRFAVLDADEVNAYSAPGGYIFVTRGAVFAARDEAELAAVLAHEIAHVNQRHIVKALNLKASDVSAGVGLSRLLGASGDVARVAFSQVVDKAVAILFEQGYSQADELDADRVATLLLALSGYDPTALKRYLQRLPSRHGETVAINTTHPPSERRLIVLSRLLEEERLSSEGFRQNRERFNRYVRK